VITLVHVLMVRKRGVVPPIDADESNTYENFEVN